MYLWVDSVLLFITQEGKCFVVVSNPWVGEKISASLASLLQDEDSLVTDFSLLHRQVFLVMSEAASSPLLFSSWEYR